MKFLSIYTPDPKTAGGPPSPEHVAEMGKLIEKSRKAGTLLATGALLPTSHAGARVRRDGDSITVVDGPYTEAKELIAGFAVLSARSKEHAIELVREFFQVAGNGECEIRQIMEPNDDFARLASYVESTEV